METPLHAIDLTALNLDAPTRELLQRLLNHIETLEAELQTLRAENQALRDEIARLKGQKGKPHFKANRPLPPAPRPATAPKATTPAPAEPKAPRSDRITIDRDEIVPLERSQVPPDFETNGYRDVIIQNLRFERDTVRYWLERGFSAGSGQFLEARLPEALQGQSFGPDLQAFVQMLYFELRVPEEKILTRLQALGLVISAGEISNILIKKHLALFADERKVVLRAGVQTTDFQHIDDTGLRVAGVNPYFVTLCNPYFSCFFIRRHKNRDTVADLLKLERLDANLQSKAECPATEPMTPGKGLPSLREAVHILVADDAPQFDRQTDILALCWIHEERHYAKLHPYFDAHRKLVDDFRSEIWAYYRRLKAYAAAPTEAEKQALDAAFDDLFGRTTGYAELDHRIALTRAKKAHLLVVLDFPHVPLDNNPAERAGRELVVKRKISYGPRNADGAEAWEVFLSLLDTCRKNGLDFYAYLRDRISKANLIPLLAVCRRDLSRRG
jgi:hypothetical protein